MMRMITNRLTQRLRTLETALPVAPAGGEVLSCPDSHCRILVANDLESRRKAYRLVYRLYRRKEYTRPHRSGMWLSIFDALPETATLLVERTDTGEALGSITVVFDSPLGLPADELYKAELDALRSSGRRVAEVVSLAISEDVPSGSPVLLKLFNSAYFIARGVRNSTDFVVTVNPRHTGFYERLMIFGKAGPERSYAKVGGAPAVLMRLDLDLAERRRAAAAAGDPLTTALLSGRHTVPAGKRSLYGQFRTVVEEPGAIEELRRQLRPMSEAELGHFLVAETDLLAEARPEQRTVLEKLCPGLRTGLKTEVSAGNYSYSEATARNLGLVTESEQEALRGSTVAIAGLGAVGGNYLLTLARMGVSGFVIADPDHFEPANLHRQAGAFTHTLGRSKVEVMAEMVRNINPEARIRVFPEGLTEDNADEFLRGVDLALDGIDFFQIDARRLLFRKAREQGIYAITSGPIGYGATLQIFDPKGMSFDDYFGIVPGMTRAQRMAAFGAGLLPTMPKGGAADPSRVDFEREKGPALASSIMLCAGIMGTEALRILLKRGEPCCAPHACYFDPYSRHYARACAPQGRTGWRDRLFRWLALRRYPSLMRLHRSERFAANQAQS